MQTEASIFCTLDVVLFGHCALHLLCACILCMPTDRLAAQEMLCKIQKERQSFSVFCLEVELTHCCVNEYEKNMKRRS
jgi:hypothetical protein